MMSLRHRKRTRRNWSTEMAGSDLTQEIRSVGPRLVWVDALKGFAIAWIFFNHLSENLLGCPYIANPNNHWPALAERIRQLRPLDGFGWADFPVNLLRYVGWAGDQGVGLFLILSGFGLTVGLLKRQSSARLALGDFYWRRLFRIYPLWWGAHLLFLAPSFLTVAPLRPDTVPFWLSLVGFRATPALIYYFSPAWWYVGLILQLYLVYPLLWSAAQRLGYFRFLVFACGIGFLARLVGLLTFGAYLDPWSRGAVFLTRLPEFAFGISLAGWFYGSPEKTDHMLQRPPAVVLGTTVYILGTILSLTLAGMSIAPFLLGAGAFVLLYVLFARIRAERSWPMIALTWVGVHSYSLFLVHHPIIQYLGPGELTPGRVGWVGAAVLALVVVTLVTAVLLEKATDSVSAVVGSWHARLGLRRTVFRIGVSSGIFCLAIGLLAVGAELTVRWVVPQEVLGWGERPSLEPHDKYGWRLKPNTKTRLRWLSYDYVVQSNALGFPGPLYTEKKGAGVFRVIVTGDAFSSAEGVNTDQAWPRLLEKMLQERLPGREVQVLNFAITGYGPDQYAAVLDDFVPRFRPDLVIVSFFVNEYFDVQTSNTAFQQSIGFHLSRQDGIGSVLRLHHLRAFLLRHVNGQLREILKKKPNPMGYFFGGFAALETGRPEFSGAERAAVTKRLARMKKVAVSAGAPLILLLVPAAAQVCGPQSLAYYPKHVNLDDPSKFDLEQPQRVTLEIADKLGLVSYDLCEPLRRVEKGSAYQPRNMHWTAEGHRAVAVFVAGRLLSDNHLALARLSGQ